MRLLSCMTAAHFAFCLFLCCCCICSGETKNSIQYLYETTTENHFVHEVTGGSDVRPDFIYSSNYPNSRIVTYYAQYIQLSNKIHELSEKFGVLIETFAVSCVPHVKICRDNNIHGFPSVLFYPSNSRNGTKLKYMDMHPQELFRMAGVSEVSESEKFQKNSSTKRSSERVTAKQSYDNLTPKSYFMHRSKSDTFHDAHLSFDLAMRTAVYSQSGPLPARPRKALQEFLTFMKKTIPLNSSMQPVVRDLLDNFEKVVTHVNSLNEIMARHSPPKPKNKWSAASSQHGTGYTAGLWILFHIMSVGLVHWNHLAMDDGQKIIPSKMADSQRNYVEHFFQCEECRLNFLADFDACMYDRCNRLVTTIDKATAQDFLQYPLWLYETHNAVNTRLRKERIDEGIESDDLTSQAGVSWPPMSFCPSCWLSIEEGRWDELEVYKFLEDTYWLGGRHSGVLEVQRPNEGETKPMSLANSNAKEIDAADASSISYMLLLCPISFIGILILYRKRQFIQKGIHKK